MHTIQYTAHDYHKTKPYIIHKIETPSKNHEHPTQSQEASNSPAMIPLKLSHHRQAKTTTINQFKSIYPPVVKHGWLENGPLIGDFPS